MTCVPFTGGKLRSVEGGFLSGLVDADCIHGLDLSRAPGTFDFTRLAVDSLWRNSDDSYIQLSYEALIRMTEDVKRIFMGHEDSKTTAFGDVHAHFKFQTGNAKLKALHESMFVGSGRFIVEAGKELTVEYQIGRMVG